MRKLKNCETNFASLKNQKREIAMRKYSHLPEMNRWLFHLAIEKQAIYK
jgi:hypothetical protein